MMILIRTLVALNVIMAMAAFSATSQKLFNTLSGQDVQPISTNFNGSSLSFVLMGTLTMVNHSVTHQNQLAIESQSADADCPHSKSESKSYKIVFGMEVKSSTKYPWMASIQSSIGFCSGSIIYHNKILTANHCTGQLHPSAFTVYAGSVAKNAPYEFYVDSIIRPPDDSNLDFAILVLNTSLPSCSATIKPICLSMNPEEDLSPGTIVTTMGWGKTTNTSDLLSLTLKEATVSIIEDSECTTKDNPDYFCANFANGGICHGDNGGPVVALKNGKYVQVGVNSLGGSQWCEPGRPMGFASVTTSTFIDFANPFHTC